MIKEKEWGEGMADAAYMLKMDHFSLMLDHCQAR